MDLSKLNFPEEEQRLGDRIADRSRQWADFVDRIADPYFEWTYRLIKRNKVISFIFLMVGLIVGTTLMLLPAIFVFGTILWALIPVLGLKSYLFGFGVAVLIGLRSLLVKKIREEAGSGKGGRAD